MVISDNQDFSICLYLSSDGLFTCSTFISRILTLKAGTPTEWNKSKSKLTQVYFANFFLSLGINVLPKYAEGF